MYMCESLCGHISVYFFDNFIQQVIFLPSTLHDEVRNLKALLGLRVGAGVVRVALPPYFAQNGHIGCRLEKNAQLN